MPLSQKYPRENSSEFNLNWGKNKTGRSFWGDNLLTYAVNYLKDNESEISKTTYHFKYFDKKD